MNNFKKGGFRPSGGAPGGRPKFGGGGRKFGGGNDRGEARGGQHHRSIQLFDAVCAQCGKNCQVPFRPVPGKAVYCRECFGKQPYVPGRNSNGADGPRPNFSEAPRQSEGLDSLKRQLDVLEGKVNRILELMNKPSLPNAPIVHFVPKPTEVPVKETKTPAAKAPKKAKKAK